jgi:hypothetical protein
MHDAAPADAGRLPLWGISAALAAYLVAAALGLPQHGRDLLVRSQAAHASDHAAAPTGRKQARETTPSRRRR